MEQALSNGSVTLPVRKGPTAAVRSRLPEDYKPKPAPVLR